MPPTPHPHPHPHSHTNTHTHTHTHTHTQTHTRTPARTPHTHPCTHTRIHTRTLRPNTGFWLRQGHYHGVRLPVSRKGHKVTLSIGFALAAVSSLPVSPSVDSDATVTDSDTGEETTQSRRGSKRKSTASRGSKSSGTNKRAKRKRAVTKRFSPTPSGSQQGRSSYTDGEECKLKLWKDCPTYESFTSRKGAVEVGSFCDILGKESKPAEPLRGVVVYLLKNTAILRSPRCAIVHLLNQGALWKTLLPEGYVMVTFSVFLWVGSWHLFFFFLCPFVQLPDLICNCFGIW
jgi:hypothetical protein